MNLPWSDEEIKSFRENDGISEACFYADKIMRPMATSLCPEVLRAHDEENNTGKYKLGPNWHAFAQNLEDSIIDEHEKKSSLKLANYYSFVNWAIFETTSYLGDEAYVTPLEGFATRLRPEQWMKFFPMVVIDTQIPYVSRMFRSHIALNMKKERAILAKNASKHETYWKPLHRRFINVAKDNKVPFTAAL